MASVSSVRALVWLTATMVGFNLLLTRAFGSKYREAITTSIGSSRHLGIAIAAAVAMHGIGSQAALGTTEGQFLASADRAGPGLLRECSEAKHLGDGR